jgi:hypothetical protein
MQWCAGTLIDRYTILTTARCYQQMDSTATFIAYLGLHNRPVIESGGDTWTGERIPIEKFIIVFIIIIKEINNIC